MEHDKKQKCIRCGGSLNVDLVCLNCGYYAHKEIDDNATGKLSASTEPVPLVPFVDAETVRLTDI